MAAPTPKEIEVLKLFRTRIADLQLTGNKQSDLYLLSWLRARDLDLAKAEDMLRKSTKWAKEYGIDQILSWKCPELLDRELPYQISGVDRAGSPIAILPAGRWDLRKVVELGYRADYIRRNQFLYSTLITQAQGTHPHLFAQFVYIVDMEGYSWRQLTSAETVDTSMEMVRIFEANYPERVKTCFIVNAPKIFAIIFALIKPLLSARTLEKVHIFSSNPSKWKAALLNNIPADQLPIKYGGTKQMAANMQNLFGGVIDNSCDPNALVEVTVEAGGKLEMQYDVKHPNTTLSWKFKTDNFDICFAVRYEGNDVIPSSRIDSHVNEQSGTYLCAKPGTYVLVFDNTYSVVRPKTLHYLITLSSPEDSDDEDNSNL